MSFAPDTVRICAIPNPACAEMVKAIDAAEESHRTDSEIVQLREVLNQHAIGVLPGLFMMSHFVKDDEFIPGHRFSDYGTYPDEIISGGSHYVNPPIEWEMEA